MIPLTTMRATTAEAGNPWVAAIITAILTAIAGYAASYFLVADQLIPFAVALLLTGACPVLGYAIATGRIGGSIAGMIGGIIGAIPLIGVLLWPLFVGVLVRSQSIGKLFIGNLIGFVVGMALFFAMATTIGQDPSWFQTAFIAMLVVWAGISGAVMTAWAKY